MLANYGRFTAYRPDFGNLAPDSIYRSFRFYRSAELVDFYALTHVEMDPELAAVLGEAPALVSGTYLAVNDAGRVRLATNDVSMAPVENATLVVIARVDDPAAMQGKAVDLATGAISDPVPAARPVIVTKGDIWRRATDAEAEVIDAALQAQPVRLRNLFRDAAYLSSDDELFPVLQAGFVTAFGDVRAAELLAPLIRSPRPVRPARLARAFAFWSPTCSTAPHSSQPSGRRRSLGR